jgi:hypothetical protein
MLRNIRGVCGLELLPRNEFVLEFGLDGYNESGK